MKNERSSSSKNEKFESTNLRKSMRIRRIACYSNLLSYITFQLFIKVIASIYNKIIKKYRYKTKGLYLYINTFLLVPLFSSFKDMKWLFNCDERNCMLLLIFPYFLSINFIKVVGRTQF